MIRRTIDGMEYGGEAHNYYWNPKYNKEATVQNGLPNCTMFSYSCVIEGGLLPPVDVITDASHWHEHLINGWTAKPYETYKDYIKEGDIVEWTTGNHVAVVSNVLNGVYISGSFYTGVHGKAYYNGSYDTRDGIMTLQQLNDYFINTYQYRYFHYCSLEEESKWCGAEPAYILVSPTAVKPEEKDPFKNQIYIGVNGLRLRSEPNTDSRINGVAPVGYLDAEPVEGEEWTDRGTTGTKWYKLEKYYVAAVEGVEWFPKQDESPIDQIEKLLKQLMDEISSLKKENEELKDKLNKIKEIC